MSRVRRVGFLLPFTLLLLSFVTGSAPSSAGATVWTCRRYRLPLYEYETLGICWALGAEVTFGHWYGTSGAKGEQFAITSKGGSFKVSATVGGVKVEVKCEKEAGTDSLSGGTTVTTGTESLELSGCKAGTCPVKGPIEIEKGKLEESTEGKTHFFKLSPASGSLLSTIVIESGCAASGTYELLGTARSEVGAEKETFGSGTGSKLELKKGAGAGAATLVGTDEEKMTITEEEVEEALFLIL